MAESSSNDEVEIEEGDIWSASPQKTYAKDDDPEEITFFRSPIALAPGMALTVATFILATYLMFKYPQTVQDVELFGLSFSLPLTGILPVVLSFVMLHYLFDSRYMVGSDYVRSIDGILSFKENDVVVETQDIRAIEVDFGIYGRIVNTGTIKIGTAAHEAQEVIIRYIYDPNKYRDLIVERRAKRVVERGLSVD